MIAQVIINTTAKKLNTTFDYNIPENLQEYISIGTKVMVPFGRKKDLEEGFVVGIKEKSEYEVKDIAKLGESLTQEQIELAKWMAKRYFCNVADCIKLMQTPGTTSKNKIQDKIINAVYLKKDIEEIEYDIEVKKIKSEKQQKILQFIKENEGATVPEIEMFTDCSRATVNVLIKNGYLEIVEKKIERNPLVDKKIQKQGKYVLTRRTAKSV